MNGGFARNPRWAFLIFIIIDVILFGIGMGVPIFCIVFGFLVGWYIARYFVTAGEPIEEVLRKVFRYAAVTSGVTFVLAAVSWGRCIVWLFNPNADYVNFGIPLILYDPRLSFIGWLVLMVILSPFLQLLTTLFGAHLSLVTRLRSDVGS
jgi:hypothetical protein